MRDDSDDEGDSDEETLNAEEIYTKELEAEMQVKL